MFVERFATVLIGLISLWAIYTILASVVGVFIVFPLASVDSDAIPMGRLQAIRLAVIGTFAFYGVMHLLQGSREVYPIHFLKTFLFFLAIMGGMPTAVSCAGASHVTAGNPDMLSTLFAFEGGRISLSPFHVTLLLLACAVLFGACIALGDEHEARDGAVDRRRHDRGAAAELVRTTRVRRARGRLCVPLVAKRTRRPHDEGVSGSQVGSHRVDVITSRSGRLVTNNLLACEVRRM